MAAVAAGVSGMGNGLSLPPNLEERGRMDMPSEGALRARSNTGGTGCVPVCCHYG
jgi:hypothetical protein